MITRRDIPIEQLTVDSMQSRAESWIGDTADRKLAASIATEGLLQDIIVRSLTDDDADSSDTQGKYGIVAGSRRYYAAMEAGYEKIPCKVIEADDLDAARTSLIENTDRRELSEQEIAQHLKLIYEFVRPRNKPTACPDCGISVENETALLSHCDQSGCTLPSDSMQGPPEGDGNKSSENRRFLTEQRALEYVARQYLGRDDADAVSLVEGHLRTAELPPMLQSLFKDSQERSAEEQTALENHGIGAQTTLGSGGGKSGTSREIVALHKTLESELDSDAIDPTDAVLETVGSLRFDEMSEQELRRTLRDFRQEVTEEVSDSDSAASQREIFTETLQQCAEDLRETYEEIEPTRPFKKVDVLGPETQHHSRWHAKALQQRDIDAHGELVRTLYQERLESLAEQEGWD